MKLLVALCVLALVALSSAKPHEHSRGCIYILGRCSEECPEGTHAYTTGCGFLTPEATCDEPKPKEDTRGRICEYSACYCDGPTVRDTISGKCVPLDQCPKKEENKEQNKEENEEKKEEKKEEEKEEKKEEKKDERKEEQKE